MLLPKPESRARERKQARTAKEAAWQKVRKLVLARDQRRCRVCGSREQIEVHHLQFRSVGGTHSTKNTAVLCKPHHDDIHAYRLTITGNADGTLHIVKRFRVALDKDTRA